MGRQITKDFAADEFACKHCGQQGIRAAFVEVLQRLRDAIGQPLIVTSGYRCARHPIEARKQKTGRHAEGIAADVSGAPLDEIWQQAQRMPEFNGIGIAPHQNYIHLDTRPGPRVLWAYNRAGQQVKWSGKWEELPG